METRDRRSVDELYESVLAGRLNRRTVLRRAMVLGLSAPVIASLLAACGDEEEAEPDADVETGADTGAAEEPTEAGGGTTGAVEETEEPEETGATEEPEASPDDTGATAGQGRGEGDLLRILYWQAPTILNPHFSQGTKDSAASSLVLEPLLDVDVEGNLIPVLAAEVPSLENGSVSEDGMSVTYTLKEGVTWSDGEPFTAEDVAFTWVYATNPDAGTTTFATYEVIRDVEVIDDTTVTLHFKEPTPGWYSPFTTGFGGQVLPKHILENNIGADARSADFNLDPIGTGPYQVVEFRPGDVIQYEINENYREADKPYFSNVEFKGGGDATAAARAALQTGEADWAWNLQVEAEILEQLSQGDVGELIITPSPSVERILVNFANPREEVNGAFSEPSTEHPFLTELPVREAFAMTTDREAIATQLYGPAGEATSNVLTAPEKFASPNTSFTFDVEGAKQKLEDAGWTGNPRSKDGVEMGVIYQTSINPIRQKTQAIIKEAWEEMGVPTELKSIDAAVYFSSDAGNPDTASHFYADFEMYTTGPSVPFPIDYMLIWRSSDPAIDIAQKANQWSGSNYSRWVNAEFNDLFEQARTELDPDRQVELFVAMNDLVVNEVVHIPLVHRADVVGASAQLAGYNPSPWTPDVRDIANWYMEE